MNKNDERVAWVLHFAPDRFWQASYIELVAAAKDVDEQSKMEDEEMHCKKVDAKMIKVQMVAVAVADADADVEVMMYVDEVTVHHRYYTDWRSVEEG